MRIPPPPVSCPSLEKADDVLLTISLLRDHGLARKSQHGIKLSNIDIFLQVRLAVSKVIKNCTNAYNFCSFELDFTTTS